MAPEGDAGRLLISPAPATKLNGNAPGRSSSISKPRFHSSMPVLRVPCFQQQQETITVQTIHHRKHRHVTRQAHIDVPTGAKVCNISRRPYLVPRVIHTKARAHRCKMPNDGSAQRWRRYRCRRGKQQAWAVRNTARTASHASARQQASSERQRSASTRRAASKQQQQQQLLGVQRRLAPPSSGRRQKELGRRRKNLSTTLNHHAHKDGQEPELAKELANRTRSLPCPQRQTGNHDKMDPALKGERHINRGKCIRSTNTMRGASGGSYSEHRHGGRFGKRSRCSERQFNTCNTALRNEVNLTTTHRTQIGLFHTSPTMGHERVHPPPPKDILALAKTGDS